MDTYKGYNIKIETDDSAEDPREWDNLGTMVCRHNGYTLGDVEIPQNYYNDVKGEDIYLDTIKDVREWIEWKYGKIAIIKPLFIYEHGGITMRTAKFDQDPSGWDTSFVGFIFITDEVMEAEYKEITAETLKRADEVLTAEVEDYAKYLEGSILQFTIEKDGEIIDSCGGYMEEEALMEDAKRSIDSDIEIKKRANESKLKAYIRNSVPLQYRQLASL